MIYQLTNLTPHINFGFGVTATQAAVSQPVTVWLDTLHNQEVYAFVLQAPGATVNKISNYEYQVSYPQPGSYQITLEVSHPEAQKSLESNILILTVT